MGTGVGLLFNQLSPRAFAKLPWQYYAVFVGCDALAAFCFFTIYPETKGKTLEEIAEVFGDTVAFREYLTMQPGSGLKGGDVEAELPQRQHAEHESEEHKLDANVPATGVRADA